jgi:alkane 1-monooxygenase
MLTAKLRLHTVTAGHFFVEHTNGHHKAVGTPLDPATAVYGETFWQFLPKCVTGSFCSAVSIEQQRCVKAGLPWYCSEMVWYSSVSAAVGAVLWGLFGYKALLLFLVQSAMGKLSSTYFKQ